MVMAQKVRYTFSYRAYKSTLPYFQNIQRKPMMVNPLNNGVVLRKEDNIALPHVYIHAATSNNTRRAYQSDIRHFLHWGGLLPTSTEMILRYLSDYAPQLNSLH